MAQKRRRSSCSSTGIHCTNDNTHRDIEVEVEVEVEVEGCNEWLWRRWVALDTNNSTRGS